MNFGIRMLTCLTPRIQDFKKLVVADVIVLGACASRTAYVWNT